MSSAGNNLLRGLLAAQLPVHADEASAPEGEPPAESRADKVRRWFGDDHLYPYGIRGLSEEEEPDAPPEEPVPASQAELPDLPGIQDDTEGGGDELPYGHPERAAPSLGGEGLEASEGAGLCVGQSAQEPAKADAQAGMLAKAFGVDGPIDPAVWAAYANSLPRPASAVGVWFLGGDSGQNVLVVEGDRYTLDELRLHGCLSQSDVQLLGYAGTYLRAAAAMAQRQGSQDTDEASAQEGAPPADEWAATEPVPASQAELPDLPGIPDDTEGGGDELPYGHPDDETGAAEEGFGLEWSWTTNPEALAQATLRARAVRQLDVGAALEAELRSIRRDVRHAQQRAALERELHRQRRQMARLAAVLTLMTNAAESEAAAVHCTDADDKEWLARWADADPWGRQLVSHARFELGRARS